MSMVATDTARLEMPHHDKVHSSYQGKQQQGGEQKHQDMYADILLLQQSRGSQMWLQIPRSQLQNMQSTSEDPSIYLLFPFADGSLGQDMQV